MTIAGSVSHSDGVPALQRSRADVVSHEARRDSTSDGHGRRLGERLRVENAPAIVTRVLRKADMAVTENSMRSSRARNERLIPAGRRVSGRFVTPRLSRSRILGKWSASSGVRPQGRRDVY